MALSSPNFRPRVPAKVLGLGRLWLHSSINLLFPPACCLCDAPMEDFTAGPLLCDDCQLRLVAGATACPACGSTLPQGLAESDDCAWCRPQKLRFDRVVRL